MLSGDAFAFAKKESEREFKTPEPLQSLLWKHAFCDAVFPVVRGEAEIGESLQAPWSVGTECSETASKVKGRESPQSHL